MRKFRCWFDIITRLRVSRRREHPRKKPPLRVLAERAWSEQCATFVSRDLYWQVSSQLQAWLRPPRPGASTDTPHEFPESRESPGWAISRSMRTTCSSRHPTAPPWDHRAGWERPYSTAFSVPTASSPATAVIAWTACLVAATPFSSISRTFSSGRPSCHT